MGGGKGGSDFDPKGKTDNEVMRFCQSFMSELFRHIGADTDVPAGDIGVGSREIGFLFGQYKRLRNEFTGVLTGKGLEWGGSLIRLEATGYGQVYFAEEMLNTRGDSLKIRSALFPDQAMWHNMPLKKQFRWVQKWLPYRTPTGISMILKELMRKSLPLSMNLKNVKRGRIKEYADKYKCQYVDGKPTPWEVPCQVALPSATQNEISARRNILIKNGCFVVSEGSNMPSATRCRRCIS